MASLVAPLVSGISTAASGTAEFYRQSTSTAAQVYSDSEGETQVTTHTLDARGAIVRYVEGRVDVVVKNVTGATVTSFTWGTDARDARVENLGFTGPDASGQVIAGGRTTVDAVLTDLFASLGATDGMVSVNGAPQTLSASISSSAGLVYNILAYGGVGDGVADDSAAFQAMVNAASTAGGGILYFPHGTYLINSGVVVASSVGKFTYLGESATGTFLKQGTSGITMLTLGASNANLLLGITFTATASNTGTLVSAGNSARATFLGCAFEAVNGVQVRLGNSATSVATLLNCRFAQAGASSRMIDGSGGNVRMVACDLTTVGTNLTTFENDGAVSLNGCTITMGSGAGSAGTSTLMSTAGVMSIVGGSIENRYASGTVYVGDNGTLTIAGAYIVCQGGADLSLHGPGIGSTNEAACYFDDFSGSVRVAPTSGYSTTRDHRTKSTSGSAITYAPDGNYMVHEVVSTGASMAFSNPSPDVPFGSSLVILYKNTSGGTITPTFPGSAYSPTTAYGSVDNGKTGVYVFTPRGTSGGGITTDLICISPQAATGYTL